MHQRVQGRVRACELHVSIPASARVDDRITRQRHFVLCRPVPRVNVFEELLEQAIVGTEMVVESWRPNADAIADGTGGHRIHAVLCNHTASAAATSACRPALKDPV